MASVRIILDLVAASYIAYVAEPPLALFFFVTALACELLRTAEWVSQGQRSVIMAVRRDRLAHRAN